ncbi:MULTISPECIES: hypothetical protein [Legionella]|nr:hypothetical protein [Legionella maceachernii]
MLKAAKNSLNRLQNPVPELMELNMRTLKSLSYIRPGEWSNLKHPQDILDKSMKMFVNNGHKMLDYFEQAAEIFERNLFFTSDEAMKNLNEGMNRAQGIMDGMTKKTRETTSTLTRKQNVKKTRK